MSQKGVIVAAHLLNDFSGSPAIFAQALEALAADGYYIHLFTSENKTGGFLDKVSGIERTVIPYSWTPNKVVTLVSFFLYQFRLFFSLYKLYRNQNCIIYVNTVLPFSACLFGAIFRKKVVCHIHEATIRPGILKPLFLSAIKRAKACCIYVSKYVQSLGLLGKNGIVIHNALSTSFWQIADQSRAPNLNKEILLVGSLKSYKGVFQFVELAHQMPYRTFRLVVNANDDVVNSFFSHITLPLNLKISKGIPSVHPYYQNASIVLNLSLPDSWIETFGLTALEAMAYGLPVIVPPIGGIAEIVPNNEAGLHVDARNIPALKSAIDTLTHSDFTYNQFSEAALHQARLFKAELFAKKLLEVFNRTD
jgi:L-malate glycosyltransferase